MHSTSYTYEDEKNNRILDIDIQYSPLPYTPARLTADPYYSEPADGGYCEDFDFKVIRCTTYDDDGNTIKDDFSKEELNLLTAEFDEIFNNDQKLQEEINDICMEASERDYDDEGSCYDDDDYGWLP
jgi:hypothetical protein